MKKKIPLNPTLLERLQPLGSTVVGAHEQVRRHCPEVRIGGCDSIHPDTRVQGQSEAHKVLELASDTVVDTVNLAAHSSRVRPLLTMNRDLPSIPCAKEPVTHGTLGLWL